MASKESRRNFLQTGIAASASLLFSGQILGNPSESNSDETIQDASKCLDYGKSFICNTGQYNSVRLWIESRTTIIDTKSAKWGVLKAINARLRLLISKSYFLLRSGNATGPLST